MQELLQIRKPRSTVAKRLGFGTLASAYGYFVTATLQLLSLPILVHAWGLSNYGKWIIISIIPSILSLSDFGFTTAATIEMSRRIGSNQYREARITYHSLGALSMSLSLVLAGIGIVAAVMPSSVIASVTLVDAEDCYVIPLMLFYSACVMQSAKIAAGLRSTGDYALGTFIPDNITLLEGICVLIAAALGGSMTTAAATLALTRCLSTIVFAIFLRSRVSWLGIGYEDATFSEIIRLSKPSVSLALIPIGLAASLQGVVAIIGVATSPAAAAMFSSVRTISRLAVQATATVSRASVPELSNAIGGERQDLIALILATNTIVAAIFILPASIVLAIFGGEIVNAWSFGKITPPIAVVVAISVSTLFHACWWNAASLMTAAGLQKRFAPFYLVASLITLALCWPAAHIFGVIGACIASMALELTMFIVVFATLSQSKIVTRDEIKSAFDALKRRALHILQR